MTKTDKDSSSKPISEVFKYYDKTNSGSLSPQDSVRALQSLGIVVEQSEIDSSYNFSKFSTLVDSLKSKNWSSNNNRSQHLKELRKAFDAIDVKKKGEITIDELRKILCEYGTRELSNEEFQTLFHTSKKTFTFDQFVSAIAASTIA